MRIVTVMLLSFIILIILCGCCEAKSSFHYELAEIHPVTYQQGVCFGWTGEKFYRSQSMTVILRSSRESSLSVRIPASWSEAESPLTPIPEQSG